jgi:hypothetical protein
MAEEYIAYTLTNAGRDIITRIIAGLNVTFKRIALGDGFDYNTEGFSQRTTLVNEVKSLTNLTMKITSTNVIELLAKFSKGDLTDSFYFREIGVYIVDPDDESQEILYAYGNKNDKGEYLTPHVDNYAIQKELPCLLSCGVASNVHINVSDNQLTTTIDFKESDWVLDEKTEIYSLNLGEINESLRIFKTTTGGKVQTSLVEINRDSTNLTTLKSLAAFDGCVVCI